VEFARLEIEAITKGRVIGRVNAILRVRILALIDYILPWITLFFNRNSISNPTLNYASMNLVERAKNILLTPKTEWPVIAGETDTLSTLLTSYVIPLAGIPAAAALLSGFVITRGATGFVITSAIIAYVSAILAFVICSYVVDFLAANFKSEKDLNKSAQLVAYSSTASWVAGILNIIPLIGWLGSLAGAVYAIYLMYLGVGTMKKTPDDQKVVYMVIIFVVLMVAYMAIAAILGSIFLAGAMM
jgi:hypothetical protein